MHRPIHVNLRDFRKLVCIKLNSFKNVFMFPLCSMKIVSRDVV
jgi:hypothetical protein